MARTRTKVRVTANPRDRVIVGYLGLVVSMAESLRSQGVSRADLVQEGCVALVRMVDRHAARGVEPFESQIKRKVWARMLRAIARRRAFHERHVRLSPAREATFRVPDPFQVLVSAELDRHLDALLAGLSEFDRALLNLRGGLRGEKRCTLSEAGQKLAVRPERVERAEFRAIWRLRRRARRLLPLLRRA